ncbi:MAG: AMP-binding protein, partial [Planctomycetota bacterium]
DSPFDLCQLLFERVYAAEDLSLAPAWSPSDRDIAQANVTKLAERARVDNYGELHQWSVENRSQFWQLVVDSLGIQFQQPFESAFSPDSDVKQPDWFQGSKLNITESCFQADPAHVAITEFKETGERRDVSYRELECLVNRVANGLVEAGFKQGDRIGMLMPMTIECVGAYLGAIRAGMVPVSIAESFSASEIATRMTIAEATGIFLVDSILRGGKKLPCLQKFLDSGLNARIILIGFEGQESYGEQVLLWNDFLSDQDAFDAVTTGPEAETNILFSSGTTGEPKAIPWTQLTPIKCAMDGHFHQNIHSQSIVAWPTSIGWMMGPWLVYASLINRATMALYDGAPTGQAFCQFIQDARVTMLGVIPSLVRLWRAQGCIEGMDWSAIESFSSTGECSNPEDMHYLISRAGYKPMIEYCGGTEIGGGYISATVVQDCVPGCFTTPALGIDMLLLQDEKPSDQGEVFLVPPSVGLSNRLLNRDHDEAYYGGTPVFADYSSLRRHGDELIVLPGGFYRACGRTDDAMNLGGIKVSAIVIEQCLTKHPSVRECAAVAIADAKAGPSNLVVFVVPTSNDVEADSLRSILQKKISGEVNPLYRIQRIELISSIPRTASNKVLRRELRNRLR